MSRGLYLGFGVLLGIAAGIGISSFFVSQTGKVPSPVLEQRTDDSELVDKTSIIFQKLDETGEHEYTGKINGKSYVYRFRLEENTVELYLRVEKKK